MSKRARLFLVFALVFLSIYTLVLLKVFNVWPQNSLQVSPSFKTWEIAVSFNTQTKKLTLKNFRALIEELRPDHRGAESSSYSILVKDKTGKNLYSSKIHITEQLFYYEVASFAYSIVPNYFPSTASSKLNNLEINTSIYIPYFEKASKIEILKGEAAILNIDPKITI